MACLEGSLLLFLSADPRVLALYDELSTEQAARAASMPRGRWWERFWFALETSLPILRPHRKPLSALIPVLVSSASDGLFGHRSFSVD